jgi:hypothetical protein
MSATWGRMRKKKQDKARICLKRNNTIYYLSCNNTFSLLSYGIIVEWMESSEMILYQLNFGKNIFATEEKITNIFLCTRLQFPIYIPHPGLIVNHLVYSLKRTDISWFKSTLRYKLFLSQTFPEAQRSLKGYWAKAFQINFCSSGDGSSQVTKLPEIGI